MFVNFVLRITLRERSIFRETKKYPLQRFDSLDSVLFIVSLQATHMFQLARRQRQFSEYIAWTNGGPNSISDKLRISYIQMLLEVIWICLQFLTNWPTQTNQNHTAGISVLGPVIFRLKFDSYFVPFQFYEFVIIMFNGLKVKIGRTSH